MKWKHLLFYLSLIIGTIGLGKLIKTLTIGYWTEPETAAEHQWRLVTVLLILIGCWIVAEKNGLLQLGGFKKGKTRNYWMLVIPLLFPGLIFFPNSNFQCVSISTTFIIISLNVFVAALMEEILFRGVIMTHLRKHYPDRSVHFSCIISSLLFGLIHFVNLQVMDSGSVMVQVLFAFFIGLVFAALLLRTRNVWLVGLVHGSLNYFSKDFCETNDIVSTGENVITGIDQVGAALVLIVLLIPFLFIYFALVSAYKPETVNK